MRLKNFLFPVCVVCVSLSVQAAAPVSQGSRFEPLKYEALNPQQKALAEQYQAKAKRILGGEGPFDIDSKVMASAESSTIYVGVRSPELTESLIKTVYILRGGVVPRKLHEIAVLIVAREWSAQFEFWSHHQHARKAGLSEHIIQAIAKGERPTNMQPDEAAVYDFCYELRKTKRVSDKTFAAVKAQLGSERAVVELMGAMGTYDTISMFHVVDRFPLPEGVSPELQPLQ